jgi:hypothetical protein
MYFEYLIKITFLKAVHRLNVYQYTKLRCPTLTGARCAFTSVVRHLRMVEAMGLNIMAARSPSMS